LINFFILNECLVYKKEKPLLRKRRDYLLRVAIVSFEEGKILKRNIECIKSIYPGVNFRSEPIFFQNFSYNKSNKLLQEPLILVYYFPLLPPLAHLSRTSVTKVNTTTPTVQ